MKSVVFFVLFATSLIVAIVLGEPVKYRQNQRARVSAKQTIEIAPAEGSEDDENEGKSEQTTLSSVQNSDGPYFAVKPYPSGPLVVLPLDQPLDQPNSYSTTVESTTSEDEFSATTDNNENIGGPYPPSGWKPAGQLMLLPNEEIAETTTKVPTTEQPTTQRQQKNQSGQLVAQRSEQEEIAVADNESEDTASATETNAKEDAEEIETTEPKKSANGKLEAEDSSESADESSSTSTEAQPSSTEQPSSKLETTSEPDSEAVDVEQQPGPINSGGQGQSQQPAAGPAVPPLLQSGPGAFIIQLPDGSLQRFVFIAAPQGVLPTANLPPNALLPVANSPFQQLIQPQVTQAAQPFGYSPIASPRVVTFSSQYQAF